MKEKFKAEIAEKLQGNNVNTWDELKSCIDEAAKRICGEKTSDKKQPWMTIKILDKMKERKKAKISGKVEEYRKLKHDIQSLCRKTKENYYQEKCKELEDLDRLHSPKLFTKSKS